MRILDLKYDAGRAARIGMVVLGLFALTAPSMSGDTVGGIPGGGTGTDDVNGGVGVFGTDGSGIRASFESLTPQQQARVMQRCQDVVASPAQANRHHLALCRTLMTLAQR